MTYSEEQYNALLAVCRSYKNDYDNAFERIKAQQREIDRLTQVAQEAQTEAYEACQKQLVEQVNQAKIDAFNKLKEKNRRNDV
mgnify:CR=1 FL=1|jgi:hypothetical protein